jgi:pimeloyl-ACP methyl ester carboxylesterase
VRELETDLAVYEYGRPDAGTGAAPTLVFLHGLTDSGQGWPEAVAHWERDYAILSVDQRGHGRSPRFTPEQLEQHPGETMVRDAVAILEQLGAAPVVLGHSLGGAVALDVAVRRPDLVRGLVLEDPAPRGPHDQQRDPARGETFVEGVRPSLDAADDAALVRVRREQHPTWPEEELLVTGRGEQQTDLDYLAYGDIKPTTPWTELYARVAVPTLVVSGDVGDDICVDENVEKGLQEIGNPRVNLTRIAGAAHCIRREQPEGFYTVVDDWLRRLP